MSRTILTFVDDLSEGLAPFAAALVDFLQSCQQAGAVVANSTRLRRLSEFKPAMVKAG